jgi:hypothetical protein
MLSQDKEEFFHHIKIKKKYALFAPGRSIQTTFSSIFRPPLKFPTLSPSVFNIFLQIFDEKIWNTSFFVRRKNLESAHAFMGIIYLKSSLLNIHFFGEDGLKSLLWCVCYVLACLPNYSSPSLSLCLHHSLPASLLLTWLILCLLAVP